MRILSAVPQRSFSYTKMLVPKYALVLISSYSSTIELRCSYIDPLVDPHFQL